MPCAIKVTLGARKARRKARSAPEEAAQRCAGSSACRRAATRSSARAARHARSCATGEQELEGWPWTASRYGRRRCPARVTAAVKLDARSSHVRKTHATSARKPSRDARSRAPPVTHAWRWHCVPPHYARRQGRFARRDAAHRCAPRSWRRLAARLARRVSSPQLAVGVRAFGSPPPTCVPWLAAGLQLRTSRPHDPLTPAPCVPRAPQRQVEDWEPLEAPRSPPARLPQQQLPPLPPPPPRARSVMSDTMKAAGARLRAAPPRRA